MKPYITERRPVKIKTYVVATLQFEALHHWPQCPYPDRQFLKDPHRHVFHIKVGKEVDGPDREIEFIGMKHEIEQYLESTYGQEYPADFGAMSCEMIALELLNFFTLATCSVFEDGENGAIVQR